MQTEKTTINLWFLGAWFGTAFTTLIFSFCLLFYTNQTKAVALSNQDFKIYTAVPESGIVTEDAIEPADARAKIVENFFASHKAPLSAYSEAFIKVADKYNLDYRLLPAISMQESNGGKRMIISSNNPFGYGIYGDLVLKFPSFEDAIERVGRALREDYLDKGLTNPASIMTKYTPPSLAKGGTWAIGVSSFMEELR